MSILISVRGAAAERLDPLPIEQENLLQEDILRFPETIPLHELKDGIRFTVLCREFQTRSPNLPRVGRMESIGKTDAGNRDRASEAYSRGRVPDRRSSRSSTRRVRGRISRGQRVEKGDHRTVRSLDGREQFDDQIGMTEGGFRRDHRRYGFSPAQTQVQFQWADRE
jgi:hypothetical protein